MRSAVPAPVLVALAVVCSASPVRAQSLDSLVESRLGRVGSGLVAGAWHEDDLVFMKAWGAPSHASGDTLHTGVLFPFPAFTEILIAATVRALDAAEAVDAHAPIGRYLPGLSESLGRMTLDQLLRHTAGLDDARVPGDTIMQVVERLGSGAVIAPPGTIFSRSRYSYPLAARVLEAATGLGLEEIIARALLRPLGMDRSTFDAEEAASLGLAEGYLAADDTASPWLHAAPARSVDGLPVLHTTVPEVILFLASWMQGSIGGGGPAALPPAPDLPEMDATFADGFWREGYQLLTELERTSSERGHSVLVRVYPESGTAVVVWGNATLGPGDAADPPDGVTLPWEVAAFMIERLVGPDIPVTVTEELPDTTRPASGANTVPLWAWTGRYVNGDRMIVLSAPAAEGSEADLVLVDGERELPLERLADGSVLARMPDGRPATRFWLVRDGSGRKYVFFGGRSFRRVEE